MSGSDWVALAGIASGVVVTIAVTALNLWYGARRERLGELRNVLDLAGGAVSEAVTAARRRVVAKGEDVKRTGESFEDKLGAVRVFENRIAIRLGERHEVTEAYGYADEELERVGKTLYDARGELDEEAQESTNQEIERVREAQLAYLRLVRGVVDRDV